MKFNKKAILDLKNKIQSRELQPNTEEATKQWLIMPMLVALGYDPYSSDITPEYTVDVGTKRGEKVDYALQINNQPVALVECKQLNVQLSDKHISQLYRYFTVSDVHIAILTNGDDYWFFTDSKKENVMDLEPYYKIKLSDATEDEMEKMAQYSKELIQHADISQVVQHERFQTECKKLARVLRTIPIERSGINKNKVYDYIAVAAILNTILCIIIHIIIGQRAFFYLRTHSEQTFISRALILAFFILTVIEVAVASYNYCSKYKRKFCKAIGVKLREFNGIDIQNEDSFSFILNEMYGVCLDIPGHREHQRKDREHNLRYEYNDLPPKYWVIYVKINGQGYRIVDTDYDRIKSVITKLKEVGFTIIIQIDANWVIW